MSVDHCNGYNGFARFPLGIEVRQTDKWDQRQGGNENNSEEVGAIFLRVVHLLEYEMSVRRVGYASD